MNLNGLRKEIAQLKAVPGVVEGKPVQATRFVVKGQPIPQGNGAVFVVKNQAIADRLNRGCPVIVD
jgi:hypothetical protein